MLLKLSIFLSAFLAGLIITGFSVYAAPPRPADNDEAYKIPAFVPQVALPKKGNKVIFSDKTVDNDEMYSMPKLKKAAAQAPSQPPAQAEDKAAKDYQQQYKEYQEKLEIYNRQMEEYRQTNQGESLPSDNDTAYTLPGQYSGARKNVQPTAISPQQQYRAPAQRYNQQYNYSDQYDRAAPSKKPVQTETMPNYYY